VTPFLKSLKRIVEKHLGTWEEGPEPPPRLRKLVEAFASTSPRATVAEWVDFAARHADSAYQQGYARGFERTERLGPDWEEPNAAVAFAEKVLEQEAWNVPAYEPSTVVPLDDVPRENAARAVEALTNAYAEQAGQRRGPRR
jgi:hypothetical protein